MPAPDNKLRSEAIERWWPTTQSLDLVEGPVEKVAKAVHEEVLRYIGRAEPVTTAWKDFLSLDTAFGSATTFTNVSTVFVVLPTRSKWTVLWNNSFLCDGYDSLCYNLSRLHEFTTLHWQAHDNTTSFMAGAGFSYNGWRDGVLVRRGVGVGVDDGGRRWFFHEYGDPLPEEDLEGYKARRKRDRLNEKKLAELLERLGAFPWQEQFYASGEKQFFVLRRENPPSRIIETSRKFEEIYKGRSSPASINFPH